MAGTQTSTGPTTDAQATETLVGVDSNGITWYRRADGSIRLEGGPTSQAPAPAADPTALAEAVLAYAEARVYASGLWRTSETNAEIDRLRDEASARLGNARVRLAAALTGPRRADALARRLLAAEQDGREAAFAALDTAEQLTR